MRESELTIRGLVLGSVIAVVFTAANIYLGLRVGITIASSIPAAVISMGILRAFNTGTIRENNIVQTVASSGGTLSSIIFVLPGLVMIGWWRNFPFFETFMICALGGVLGVLFSIPLRRALVVNSPLPFPEGVAAAEVLKVGARDDEAPANIIERKRGPIVVLYGAIVAAGLQIVTFTGVAAANFATYFRLGAGVSGFSTSYSLALIGAGHLVGISVGLAMLTGIIIAWGVGIPLLSQGVEGDIAEIAEKIRGSQIRFIGAGTIGVAAIWSLLRLVGPLYEGMMQTARAGKGAAPVEGDRDLPVTLILLLSVVCLAAIGWLLMQFVGQGPLASISMPLAIGGVVFTVIVGAFIATVAGYMAGLIGSSNSPVSGIGILAVVSASLLLAQFVQPQFDKSATDALIAFALFTVSIVFSVATISNDNLQDLKTGQLVGASPWKQQAALIVGVIAGALVTGPVLDLLNQAYGFPGDPNRAAIAAEPLGAPQAVLISTLARGVLNAQLDWNLIAIGAWIGAVAIVVDEALGNAKWMRLPPMAIGIGIYLPMDSTSPVILGAILGWLYNSWIKGSSDEGMLERFGVLLASGLIVGESLLGVMNAGAIVATSNATPFLLVGPEFTMAPMIGAGLFALVVAVSYVWVSRQAKA